MALQSNENRTCLKCNAPIFYVRSVGRWTHIAANGFEQPFDHEPEVSQGTPPPHKGQPHTEAELLFYSVWTHYKGGVYVVLGIATDSTNSGAQGTEGRRLALYYSTKYRGLRVRSLEEFLDGRFQPMPVESTQYEWDISNPRFGQPILGTKEQPK